MIEDDFKKAFDMAQPLLKAKLAEAAKALYEAEGIAEKYGIPFSSSVSALAQEYFPDSFESMYEGIDHEVVDALTGCYVFDRRTGWQHSQVC